MIPAGKKKVSPADLGPLIVQLDAETGITGSEGGGIDAVQNQTPSSASDGTYSTGVKFRGINRAGPEYGDDWDGWTGQTYFTFPSSSQLAAELSYLAAKGMNVIRLPISWERIQHTLNGALNATYQGNVSSFISQATAAGFYVILDLHNYHRYATGTHSAPGVQQSGYVQRVMGDGFLTTAHLQDIWVRLANLYKSNTKVIFNLMNEPHDFPMNSTNHFAGQQAVLNSIRSTGSTNLILIANTRGSDIDHWSSYSPGDLVLGAGNGGPKDSVAALAITDSANNYAFDMHTYQGGSNWTTHADNIISWARANNKKLFFTEIGINTSASGGGSTVANFLTKLNNAGDVVLGWNVWNLTPYNVTQGNYTSDAPAMAWYSPFLTPNILSGSSSASPIVGTAPYRPVWSASQFRSGTKHAIHFEEGTNDRLNLSSAQSLPNGFTFFAVVKFTSNKTTPTQNLNVPLTLFSYNSGTGSFAAGFTAGIPRYRLAGVNYDAPASLNDGKIHSVAFTHSTSGAVQIFVDGVLSASWSGIAYPSNPLFNSLGSGYLDQDSFQGDVAELLAFSAPIDAQSIRDLCTRGMQAWA